MGMLRLLIDEFHEALAAKKHRGETRAKQVTGKREAGCAHVREMENDQGDSAMAPEHPPVRHRISIATGYLAAPFLKQLAKECMEAFPDRQITVYPIRNDFFGELITVSGLLTGQDLVAQLRGRDLGERLLLPCNLLRSGEEVFLDDMTLEEFKTALQVETDIVKSSGQELLFAMLGREGAV